MKYIIYTLSFIFCSLNIFSQQYEVPFVKSGVSVIDEHVYLTGRSKKGKKSVEVIKLDKSLKVVAKSTIPYKKKSWPGMLERVGDNQLALYNGYGSMFNPTMVCHLFDDNLNQLTKKEFSNRSEGSSYNYQLQKRNRNEGVYLNLTKKKQGGVELTGMSHESAKEAKEIWKKTLLPEVKLEYTQTVYSEDYSSCILIAKENEKGKENSIHVIKIDEATGKVLKKTKINMKGKLFFDFIVWKSGGEFLVTGVYGAKKGVAKIKISEGFFIKSFDFATGENVKSSDTPITTLDDNLKTSGVGAHTSGHIKVVDLKKVGNVHKAILFTGFWDKERDPMNQNRFMTYFHVEYIQQVTIGTDLSIKINSSRKLYPEEWRHFAHEYFVLIPMMNDDMTKGRIILNDGYGTFNGGKYEVRIEGSTITVGQIYSNLKSPGGNPKTSSFIPNDYKSFYLYDSSDKKAFLKVVKDKTFK